MCYVSFGQGEKAFVILPGLSDGLATVKGKALLLAKPYRKFFDRWTVYMFSRKNRLPEGCSIRDMADDQAEALAALGIGRVSVMGVSQGGMIAQAFAAEHAEAVDRLVLAVSAPYANETVRDCVLRWKHLAETGQYKELITDISEKSYSEEYLKKYRKYYPILARAMERLSYDRFYRNTEAILGFDMRGELDRISCPTLIIGGTEDKIVGPGAAREMKEGIAHSELFLYGGLGHAAYEEAADFNDRVLDFLER